MSKQSYFEMTLKAIEAMEYLDDLMREYSWAEVRKMVMEMDKLMLGGTNDPR